MFKRSILIGVLMAASIASAFAQSLPVKAPPANPCTPTSCTGFYVGGGVSGNGSNLDIIGQGINGSVFAGGVIPDFHGGYIYKSGNWLYGAEAGLGYLMNSGVTVNGAGVNQNGLFSYQVARVGGDLGALFGTQTPITIPPQLANSLISGYVQIGTAEKQLPGAWLSGMVSGAGAFFDIGPKSFINIDYKNVQLQGVAGGVKPGPLNILSVGFNYKF